MAAKVAGFPLAGADFEAGVDEEHDQPQGQASGGTLDPRHGADVNQASPVIDKVRQYVAQVFHAPEEVDVEHQPPLLSGGGLPRARGDHPGIGH